MNNEDKAKQLYHEYEDAKCCGVPMARGSVAFNAAMEMARWKDKQFSDRVEMTLCIDCHEFKSCENCQKYQIKKELLGL